jgi:hypothetical protein
VNLTGKYTGSYGNTIRVVLTPGTNSTSGTPTWKVVVQLGSNQPETFDRIPQGTGGAVWANIAAAINNTITGSQYIIAALPGTPSTLNPGAAGASVTLSGGTDGAALDDANVPPVAATGTFTFATYDAGQVLEVFVGGIPYSYTQATDLPTSVAGLAGVIGSSGVTTATASGDVLTLTANTPGAAGNSISIDCATPQGTTTVVKSGAFLTGGVDAIPNVLIGQDGNAGDRTGMYTLRGLPGLDVVWLCGFHDSENWATIGEFAQSEQATGFASFAPNQTVAQVVSAKLEAELDSPYLVMLKDWVTYADSFLNLNVSVPPACVAAGISASLSPEQSPGNKAVNGIIGTDATLGANPQPYSNSDLATLQANGINLICNPIPLGQVFGLRHGLNTSSNSGTNEISYSRKTNSIIRDLSTLLGQFVDMVQGTSPQDPVRLAVNSTLTGYFQPQVKAFEIDAYTVKCDLTNNSVANIKRGLLVADIAVAYMNVISKFIVNLTAGQTVTISTSSVTSS